MQPASCRLYVISPERFALPEFVPQLEQAFEGGDIAAFQLRLKGCAEAEVKAYAKALQPICARNGAAFILNDYPAVAAEIGADGLHLGADDMPVAKARKIVGDRMAIGASCYASRHRAMEAGEDGADYVAFGAFYHTTTKEPRGRPDPEILAWWSTYTVLPCVAIGGIKAHNLGPLVRAGADFIALVTAVWEHPAGPKAAVAELNDAIAAALEQKEVKS